MSLLLTKEGIRCAYRYTLRERERERESEQARCNHIGRARAAANVPAAPGFGGLKVV